MDTRNNDFDFDFTPIGQAIKKARTAKGMTREQLARIVDYDPRHLQAIENEGQKPSLELFIQLVTMFGVSVDEYIFPDNEVKRSSVRRRLDAELDKLNDKELSIVEATVSGLFIIVEIIPCTILNSAIISSNPYLARLFYGNCAFLCHIGTYYLNNGNAAFFLGIFLHHIKINRLGI